MGASPLRRPAALSISLIALAVIMLFVTHIVGRVIAVARADSIPGALEPTRHPSATAARTLYVSDTATLHLQSHQGTQILNEQGQAHGTLSGSLNIKIVLSYTQATVTFLANPSGGSLSGHGVESYYVAGGNGHFQGTMAITHGTGRYAHASAPSINLSGTIKRKHYEVLVKISGTLHM